MKTFVLALSLVVALAACRDKDPDDTPPVGRAADGVVPAALVAKTAPSGNELRSRVRRVGTTPAMQRGAERVRRLADARVRLDAAWNACESASHGDGARCRDEAVFAYDAATRGMHDSRSGDAAVADDAMPSGVLAGYDDLAVVQVTGTRG